MRTTLAQGARGGARAYLALTLLLCLAHLLVNARYLAGGVDVRQKDVAAHLKVCTKFILQLRDLCGSSASPAAFARGFAALFHQESMPVEHIWIWPRLVYAVAAAPAALFGPGPRVLILSNAVWLVLLLLSVHAIGASCLNPRTGFVSAAIVSLFPATYGMSRKFGLDFPLMAMVALAVLLLVRTSSFRDTRASLAFGCAVGIGLLVKVQLVIFICGPLLYALLVGARRSFRREAPAGRVLANAALAALAALVLSAPFWWGNIGDIVTVFIRHAEAREGVDPHHLAVSAMSARYFAYYVATAAVYASPPLFALACLLLPSFLRSPFRERSIVLLWAAGPYALFTALKLKYGVFVFPALPALGVVLGAGLDALARRGLRRALTAAALGWGACHFCVLSFSSGEGPYAGCAPYSGDAFREDGYPLWAHPVRDAGLEETARRVARRMDELDPGNRYSRAGIVEFGYSNRDYLFVDAFEYFMESENPSRYVYRCIFSPDSFLECMGSFNFLVVLNEGERAEPDFAAFEEHFLRGGGAAVRGRYLGGPDAFLRLAETYRGYPVAGRDYLPCADVSVFLLEKPPFPVGASAEVPAACVSSANVFIAYPRIGVDDALRHPPTIGDYDVLFPYDVDFPLVPPGRRDPGERCYAAYRLAFAQAGEYELLVRAGGGAVVRFDAELDGKPVGPPGDAPAGADAVPVGTFLAPRGTCELKLLGRGGFPVISGLMLRRVEGGEPRPPG